MKKIIPLCAFAILMSGCYVQSICPFYTEETKVELNQINGEWISIVQMGSNVENKKITPWSFGKDKIVSYDQKNIKSELECAYFKVGENLFVDITAGNLDATGDSDEKISELWAVGITMVHVACKVEFNEGILELTPMYNDWLWKKIEKQTLNIPYLDPYKNNEYIFTATSEEWVQFLKKHGDNQELFNKKHVYKFKRK